MDSNGSGYSTAVIIAAIIGYSEGDSPVHSFEMGSNRSSHVIFALFDEIHIANYAGQF